MVVEDVRETDDLDLNTDESPSIRISNVSSQATHLCIFIRRCFCSEDSNITLSFLRIRISK
jgi:hypothetical protein